MEATGLSLARLLLAVLRGSSKHALLESDWKQLILRHCTGLYVCHLYKEIPFCSTWDLIVSIAGTFGS